MLQQPRWLPPLPAPLLAAAGMHRSWWPQRRALQQQRAARWRHRAGRRQTLWRRRQELTRTRGATTSATAGRQCRLSLRSGRPAAAPADPAALRDCNSRDWDRWCSNFSPALPAWLQPPGDLIFQICSTQARLPFVKCCRCRCRCRCRPARSAHDLQSTCLCASQGQQIELCKGCSKVSGTVVACCV